MNFANTNLGIFSTKYYVIFVLIFSNAQSYSIVKDSNADLIVGN